MADEGSLGQAYAQVTLDSGHFDKGLLTTQASMKSWHSGVMKYAKVVIGVVGVAAVVKGLNAAIAASVKYDSALRNVWTITNQTWKEMRVTGEVVTDLANRFGKTGAAGLEALYQIYSAGHKGADGIKVLEASLIGAQAGLTSVETWADVTTTVINAFGKSAEDAGYVTDVLFKIVERGKVTGEQLASSFGTLAAIAAPMGASFEEVSGALMTLTRRGIAADQAVTSITQAIMQLARPTEAAQKIVEDLGFSSGVVMMRTLGFADALAEVTGRAKDYNYELTDLFTNKRAVLAVLPLAGTAAAEYAEDIREAAEATGAASDASEKQTGKAIEQARAQAELETATRRLGDALEDLLDLKVGLTRFYADIVEWLSAVTGENWDMIAAGVGALAVAFATLVAANIVVGITAFTASVLGLNLALAATPYGALAALLTAAGVMGAYIPDVYDSISKGLADVVGGGEQVIHVTQAVVNAFKDAVLQVVSHSDTMLAEFLRAGNVTAEQADALLKQIMQAGAAATDALRDGKPYDDAMALFSDMVARILAEHDLLEDGVLDTYQAMTDAAIAHWRAATNAAKKAAMEIAQAFSGLSFGATAPTQLGQTFGVTPQPEPGLTFGVDVPLPVVAPPRAGEGAVPDPEDVIAWTDAFETLQDAMAEDPTTALSDLQSFLDTFGEMPAAFLAGRGAAQSLLGDLQDLSGKFEVGAGITWIEDFLGITAERAEKAAAEQKRLDEAAGRKAASEAAQAQRQAVQDARNVARDMLGAFEDSFLTPALQALGTDDWLAAAAGVQSMAVGFPELLAAAEKVNEALRATGQEEMTHLDVLRLLIRAEGSLVGALEDRIRLAELAADWDLAAALRKQLEEIEKMGEAPVAALPGREKIGAWLAKGWDKMISAAIDLLPSGVGRIAGGIVDAFTAALDPKNMGDVANMLSSAVGVVIAVFDLISSGLERRREELLAQIDLYINAFSEAGSMLNEFVRGFSTGGSLSEIFQAGMQAIISAVQMMTLEGAELIATGIGMMFDLVTSLVGAITGLIKQSDAYQALQEESSSIWKAIADLLGEFLWPLAAALRYLREWLGIQSDVNEGAKELAASLNVPLGWKAERIRYAASIAGQAPLAAAGDQIEIPEWAEPFGRALAEAIMKLLEGYGITGWGDLLASIREKAADLWTWITGRLPEIMGAVESAIDQVCEFLDRHGLNIEGIIQRVKDGIQWFIDKGPGFISDALGFFDRLVVAAEGLKDWILSNLPTWTELEGAIDRWMKELGEIADFDTLSGDLQAIEEQLRLMKKAVVYAIAVAAGAIVGATAGINLVRWAAAATGALLGGLAAFLFDLLSPDFQHGGVIPGPIGSRQLISAHGGETVLPTHQPDFMKALAGLSQPIHLHATFQIGSRVIAKTVVQELTAMNDGLPPIVLEGAY